MPTGESAGGVYITIDADGSPAIQQFAKVETSAKAAGQNIAASLNAASVSAQDLGFATGQIVGAIERLTVVVQEEGAAATLAAQRNLELSGSLTTVGAAAGRAGAGLGGATSQARILGSELRVLSGTGGLLAAEKFLTMIPGIAAAANFALPIIGLAAVVELAAHGIEKFTGMSEAEKKAQENIQQLVKDTHALNEEISRIDTDTFRKLFGATATIGAEQIPKLEGNIAAQRTLIASTEQMIVEEAKLRKEREDAVAQNPELGASFIPDPDKELQPLLAKQKTALAVMLDQRHAANVDIAQSQQADNKKGDALAKQSSDAAQSAEDEKTRIIQASSDLLAEQTRKAAEAAQKAADAEKKKADALKTVREGQLKDLAESGREMDEQIRRNAESAKQASEAYSREGTLAQRTGQLATQTQGVKSESDNEVEKLRAQQQYAEQIVHTKGQELAYAQQMAAFDEKALQLKISLAQQELFQAVAEQNLIPTREGELKIAEDGLKIEQDKAALLKKQIEDETALLRLKQQQDPMFQLGQQVQQTVSRIPQDLGGAVAGGVFNGGKGGADVGKQVADAMKNVGKQLFSEVLTSAIQQLIIKTGLQTLATTVFGAIFKSTSVAQAAAMAANTAALGAVTAANTAHTIATTASTIAETANTVAMGILTAAVTELSAAVWVQDALVGFASGGRPAPGVPYIVGENGPEIRIDDSPGIIIPSIPKSGGVGIGMGSLTSSMSVNSASSAFSVGAIHLHGVRDMQDVARRLPNVLKASSNSFSPARN